MYPLFPCVEKCSDYDTCLPAIKYMMRFEWKSSKDSIIGCHSATVVCGTNIAIQTLPNLSSTSA